MNKLYILKNVTSNELIKKIAEDNSLKNYSIVKNAYGKPYFKDNSIFFNISNSSDLTVGVISNNEIGIDIQKIKYNQSIVDRVFTDNEKLFLEESKNKPKTFTLIWTMKESYVKMLGIGISYGLKNIDTINMIDRFKVIEYEDYIITICE